MNTAGVWNRKTDKVWGMNIVKVREDLGISLAPCPVCWHKAVFLVIDAIDRRNKAQYLIRCGKNRKHKQVVKGNQEVSLSLAMRWNEECMMAYSGKMVIFDEVEVSSDEIPP